MKMADIEIQTVEEYQQRIDITDRIWAHYDHAKEEHPHFCDDLLPAVSRNDIIRHSRNALASIRKHIEIRTNVGHRRWDHLLNCKVWEVVKALATGNKAHAVGDLYDCIAVCLRTIDVLEGRQALGKPNEGGKTV